jgi:hypothetical protein
MNVVSNNETGFVHKEDNTVANGRKPVREMGDRGAQRKTEKWWSQSKSQKSIYTFLCTDKGSKRKAWVLLRDCVRH